MPLHGRSLGLVGGGVGMSRRRTFGCRPRAVAQAEKWWPMLKGLCWGSLGVAALMTLLFLLDLFTSFPFGGASTTLNIFGIIAGAIIIYLSWDTVREFPP